MKRILPLTICLLTLASLPLSGQDQKAAFDPSKAQLQPIGLPSPIDKFLGLDQMLEAGKKKPVDWKGAYNKLSKRPEISKLTDEADISLALGVRIADGVMAIKATYAEGLNECAADIEELAGKLGVSKDSLRRAEKVRADANKGQWLVVFWELGCLQVDIMRALNEKSNERRRTLIISAGWLQGAHYAAHMISENYTPELSNLLREPMLVKALQDELQAVPSPLRDRPRVKMLMEELKTLHQIVNIPIDGTISPEDVKRMTELADKLCREFVS